MFVVIMQALFFFLPAYVANMSPVIFGKVSAFDFLRKPIDGRRKLGHLSFFGEHKTYYGFIVGFAGAIIAGFLQVFTFQNIPSLGWLFLFRYNFTNGISLAFLLGFGGLLGDLLKSFIKRRLNIQSGKPFFPFDQLDFVIGGLLFGALIYFPSWWHVVVLLLLTPLLHVVSNIIGYKMGLKKVWW